MQGAKSENLVWNIFIFIGLLIIIGGLVGIYFVFQYEGKIETTGVITQISTYETSDDKAEHEVYVSYVVDGEEYESKLNGYSSGFYEGQELDIYYDSDNPNKIGSKSLDYILFLIPVFGLVFLIIGGTGKIIKIKKKSLEKNLRKNGQLIQANYVETILNKSYSINHKHPYNIICEWQNPQNNEKYEFKSINLWENPENIIKEKNITTFPVYINPENMKKYFVDIDILTENI